MPEEHVISLIIAALVGLIALLGFIRVMTDKKTPTQAVECAFQHEKIGTQMSRTEKYMEAVANNLRDLSQIAKEQAKASELRHNEMLREIRKS